MFERAAPTVSIGTSAAMCSRNATFANLPPLLCRNGLCEEKRLQTSHKSFKREVFDADCRTRVDQILE